MRRGGVLSVISQYSPDAEMATVAVTNKFRKNDEKARSHIVHVVGEELDTLITSLVLSGAPTKVVWKMLIGTHQNENIHSKLTLRGKIYDNG